MPLAPDQFPDDLDALKRLVVARTTELETTQAELAAAKNGLLVMQLTIEKLKAQIAKFRREKFGASSERVDRTLEQLELALEEAEAAKGRDHRFAPSAAQAGIDLASSGRLRTSRAGTGQQNAAPSTASGVSAPRCHAQAVRGVQALRRYRSA
jgi:hypothetical protein